MKPRGEDFVALELPDLIRMNRLVRASIELSGFEDWYAAISVPEQCALLYHLHLYAQQAGYDEAIWAAASNAVHFSETHSLHTAIASFRGGSSRQYGDEFEWLLSLDAKARHSLLPFLVSLFGTAEGRVYADEREECCNHWWHRDLLDERVVQALLSDSNYGHTSRKDDQAIK